MTTKKETEFLMLEKADYIAILNKSEHKIDIQSKLSFIESHPLSKTFAGELINLAQLGEISIYPQNTIIVRDGEKTSNIHFIM